MEYVTQKFYEALDRMNITYDEETGRLSSSIMLVIYDRSRKVKANRIFIFKNYFLIIYDEMNDTRKIYFKNVKAFKNLDHTIEL